MVAILAIFIQREELWNFKESNWNVLCEEQQRVISGKVDNLDHTFSDGRLTALKRISTQIDEHSHEKLA